MRSSRVGFGPMSRTSWVCPGESRPGSGPGLPIAKEVRNAPGCVVAEARPPVRAHQEERTRFRPIRGSGRGDRRPNGEQAALGSRRGEAKGYPADLTPGSSRADRLEWSTRPASSYLSNGLQTVLRALDEEPEHRADQLALEGPDRLPPSGATRVAGLALAYR